MRYRVLFSPVAEQDLLELHTYLLSRESPLRAAMVIERIEAACASLAELPFRGNVPPELDHFGIRIYREIHVPPWRIIYEVKNRDVMVHAILDGRRDMKSLLIERLVRRRRP